MEKGELNVIKMINKKITENKKIKTLSEGCNYDKAEEIFNFLNSFINEIGEEPGTERYYIPETTIISAYSDGTFSSNTFYGILERDHYEIEYLNISNIISIKCITKDQSIHEIHFTGRIDNDESYEIDLNIENHEINENKLFEDFIKQFEQDYDCSAGALDEYISFCTNFGVDSIQPIFKAMLECMKDIKENKSFTDRKGAIDYLKNI